MPEPTEDVQIGAQYIGDGVYVSYDGYQVWVQTQNPGYKIALESPVMRELVKFSRRVYGEEFAR